MNTNMTDAGKARLREVRELVRERQVREKKKLFVAEGAKVVSDMVAKGCPVEAIYVSNSFAEGETWAGISTEVGKKGIPVFSAIDRDIENVSGLRQSQGVLALIKMPSSVGSIPASGETAFLVLCDGVQDPGNLGSIIRTASAFGAGAVLLTGDSADAYSPKTVRGSSGTVMDLPVVSFGTTELLGLKESGYRFLVGCPPGQGAPDIADVPAAPGGCVLVFGSEGKGVSEDVTGVADGYFTIPISGVESLNVVAAAAISLYVFGRATDGAGVVKPK